MQLTMNLSVLDLSQCPGKTITAWSLLFSLILMRKLCWGVHKKRWRLFVIFQVGIPNASLLNSPDFSTLLGYRVDK